MTATFPRTMGYGLGGSFQRGASAFGPWVTADPYDYPLRDQTMTTAPTFPPFKFEPRRARIDWRLLHGVDISAMMRDVDLDTLEKIVNIVAFGDIEAEDTRHLTELNFIKIFRLSQMMIEYLLYVQDCLQSSNGWLQQDRGNMDKYVQAARLRIRELEANLKMNKRELRRTRKTIKTYELLAVLNDGKGTKTMTMPSAFATTAVPSSPPQQQPQAKAEPNPVNVAMEALLRKELAALAERLSKATLECQTLRSERDDLFQAVKDLETSVKTRTQLSEASSPQGYGRQNFEAVQTIQGLQDQLNRATAEITKLRNEKGDLAEEFERATTDKRQLQDEKSRLLSEIASRSPDSRTGIMEPSHGSDNLGSMLLDADRQKAAMQEQLAESQAEIAALQKQLMKAMKERALGALPQSQSLDDRALRELEATKAQLERDLAELRQVYNDDVRQLQEELEGAQAKAVDANRRLEAVRVTGGAAREGAARMGSPGGGPSKAGERRGDADEMRDADDRPTALLAEYEATNERLNQQLMQLKGERNMFAEEVEQLRAQTQGRSSPQRGDVGIARDWRTEEIERLKDELQGAHRRILDLQDAVGDREAAIERLRARIRELQALLDERNRQQKDSDGGASRVKQQVQHFERMGGPGKQIKTQQSFSFGEEAPPTARTVAETPTSARKPVLGELPPPPRSPLRAQSPQTIEEVEPTSPVFAPPSPIRPGQVLEPVLAVKSLQRIRRPTQAEATGIQQAVIRRVAGLKPEALDMLLQEEIRVITENPYENNEDDEALFRAMMPNELDERPGVRSVQPHHLEDLETARSLYTTQLLAVADDELAQYGVDTAAEMLGDKAYGACMQELAARRSAMFGAYPKEVQDRAEDLRNYLLTHLELLKRGMQQQQQRAQQQQLQLEQQRKAAAGSSGASDGRLLAAGDSLLPAPGFAPSVVPAAALLGRPAAPSSREESPAAMAVSPKPSAFASVVEAATKPLSVAAEPASKAGPPPADPVEAIVPQRQLPAFPSRQPSLQPSNASGSEAGGDEVQSMLPPAQEGFRPASETVQVVAPQRAMGRQGSATAVSSVHTSREPSIKNVRSEASMGEQQRVIPKMARSSSSGNSEAMAPRKLSLPPSGASSPPPAPVSPAAAPAPTAFFLSREEPQNVPERVVIGHARPTQVAKPGVKPVTAPAVVAPAPAAGGNMNMSIRSVKYQESDFDDEDDDVLPLPQPKPVRRVVEEDEYALTEDEETQQDMGIEDSDDFSPAGRQPKMLMRGGSPPRAPVPSRLGAQSTPAVNQSRGWATDEPLQPAPAKPIAISQKISEVAEMEELESIHSFENVESQSLPRAGAWGGTSLKPPAQTAREPSAQLSRTSKQSGWNEAINSFGGTSAPGDEIQAIQDIGGLDSFNDNIRPVSRMAPQRGSVAPPQPTAAAPTRTVAQRASFSSEFSDVEYA